MPQKEDKDLFFKMSITVVIIGHFSFVLHSLPFTKTPESDLALHITSSSEH